MAITEATAKTVRCIGVNAKHDRPEQYVKLLPCGWEAPSPAPPCCPRCGGRVKEQPNG